MEKNCLLKLDDAENDYNSAKKSYLKSYGWKYTCETPGNFWLYKKEFGEVTLLCPESTAINITRMVLENE